MDKNIKIGIIGEFHPDRPSHDATNQALNHAAEALSIKPNITWLLTQPLENDSEIMNLVNFDALWCAPAGLYKSKTGTIRAIQFAREKNWPFIGTWGGFQYTLLEYFRNVLGMEDAAHAEVSPKSSNLVISPLSCSLVGETQTVFISPDTLAYNVYKREKAKEIFNCNYGFNETYRKELDEQNLKIVGVDGHGNARIVELPTHRFFMATLFLPQFSSSAEKPHPLIIEYLNAAKVFKVNKKEIEIKSWHK